MSEMSTMGISVQLLVATSFVAGRDTRSTFGRQRRSRELTLRVDEVPAGTSAAALQSELQSVVASAAGPALHGRLDGLRVRSLAARDGAWACATVTARTPLPEDRLLVRLRRGRGGRALPYRFDCGFYGITPLHEDVDGARCDVVTVPGLASHAVDSWRAPGSDDLWLRDWLSGDVPNIRVLLYGYDTELLKSNNKSSVEDLGRRFLESLTAFRTSNETERRPIIFIGHSLGGLIIKEAGPRPCLRSPAARPTHRLLSRTCCGLLFFGVPQLGMRSARLASVVEGQPNQALVRALVADEDSEPSDILHRMSDDFARCFQDRLCVVCFFERRLSPTLDMQSDGTLQASGPHVLIVTKKSATSTGLTAVPEEDIVPLDVDHAGLVKFASPRDDAYVIVKERVKSLVSGAAPWTVNRRRSQAVLPEPHPDYVNLSPARAASMSEQRDWSLGVQHGTNYPGPYTVGGWNSLIENVAKL